MKKVFSLLLALVMCQLITATTFAASSTSDANSTDEQLISDYFSAVDQQMWDELEDVLSDSYYQSISSTIDNNAYAENNLGLYNIEAVNQVSLLGEIPASTYEYYSPIIAELEDDGVEEIIAYVVECELDTYEDTPVLVSHGVEAQMVFSRPMVSAEGAACLHFVAPERSGVEDNPAPSGGVHDGDLGVCACQTVSSFLPGSRLTRPFVSAVGPWA